MSLSSLAHPDAQLGEITSRFKFESPYLKTTWQSPNRNSLKVIDKNTVTRRAVVKSRVPSPFCKFSESLKWLFFQKWPQMSPCTDQKQHGSQPVKGALHFSFYMHLCVQRDSIPVQIAVHMFTEHPSPSKQFLPFYLYVPCSSSRIQNNS